MSGDELLEDSAEELFEDAPCGYLTTDLDGHIIRVNRTFEAWTGRDRRELLRLRFQDLLAPGGRIFYDTNYAPLLHLRGEVREIAVDIIRADATRLPALINAVLRHDAQGAPRAIRTTVFDATDRRRYERELVRAREHDRGIAARLQHSLLDGVLPVDDRFDLAVAYLPSDDGLSIGGDWYDAIVVGEDSLCVVIGDVVGRGLEAAAAMGQLRSAVRALAATGLQPGPLLDALDAYTRRHDVGDMATVAVLRLDLETGALRVACAGQLPPVVLAPGHAPRLLELGRSAPLGAYSRPIARPDADDVLADGALLVLYTDGLTERADRDLDTGARALMSELEARRDLPTRRLTDEITATMLAGHRVHDDVCLLALRRGPTDDE